MRLNAIGYFAAPILTAVAVIGGIVLGVVIRFEQDGDARARDLLASSGSRACTPVAAKRTGHANWKNAVSSG